MFVEVHKHTTGSMLTRCFFFFQGNMTTACSSAINSWWFWYADVAVNFEPTIIRSSPGWSVNVSSHPRNAWEDPCSNTRGVAWGGERQLVRVPPPQYERFVQYLRLTHTSFPLLAHRSDSRVLIMAGLPYIEMQMEDGFKHCKAPDNNARMLQSNFKLNHNMKLEYTK